MGPLKNGGREWRPSGDPERVSTHDFPDKELGKAVPYGIYDLAANTGWVSVGTDHDTAAFAVESIRRWWKAHGRDDYPQARRLLINTVRKVARFPECVRRTAKRPRRPRRRYEP